MTGMDYELGKRNKRTAKVWANKTNADVSRMITRGIKKLVICCWVTWHSFIITRGLKKLVIYCWVTWV